MNFFWGEKWRVERNDQFIIGKMVTNRVLITFLKLDTVSKVSPLWKKVLSIFADFSPLFLEKPIRTPRLRCTQITHNFIQNVQNI